MIIDQFDDYSEIKYVVCEQLVKKIFKKQGLQINRSEYDDNGFWAEHSPGTEENWIDVFLFIQLFTGEKGESPGYFVTIKIVSLDEDFPIRKQREMDFDISVNFDTIVDKVDRFMNNIMKVMVSMTTIK